MQLLEKISRFVSMNLAVIVLLFTAVALMMPDMFTWATPQIPKLLGVVMFGMGMILKVEDFQEIFRQPLDIFVGLMTQYTVMPVLGYVLAVLFELPPELAAGVILVGTCPGGVSSNIITYLAKGDLALSISVTMASTIIAPIITPLFTWLLAGEWVEVSLTAMIFSIVQIVVAPIVLGLIVKRFFANFVERIVKILPLISIISIMAIITGVISVNSERIFEAGTIVIAVVALHNLLGYALGFGTAKIFDMNPAKVKAITIEVGMQNSGLASSLALIHFSALAAIPGALFTVWHSVSGSILANYMSKRQ